MSKLSELRDSKKQAKRQPPRSLLEQIRDSVMSGVNGYVARQGRLANDGLNWANQGFDRVRGGDPLGLLDELGGATSYLASPVTALVPTRDEIAASQLPEWAKPVMSGVSQGALVALPGPDLGPAASAAGRTARGVGEQAQMYADDFAQRFGVDVPAGAEVYGAGPIVRKPLGIMATKPGLGRGVGDLLADGTQAEQAALKRRLETEADQAKLDAIDAADPGKDVKPETVQGWIKPKVTMESIMRDELAQAVAVGDTAAADKIRRELRGMGYQIEDGLPPEMNPRGPGTSGPPGILSNMPGRIRGQ